MGMLRRPRKAGLPAASPVSTLGILAVAVIAVIAAAPAARTGAKALHAAESTAHSPTATSSTSMAPSVPLTGSSFGGTSAVGALFQLNGNSLGDHFCTASVVDSAAKDLIITAAHCLTATAGGADLNMAFAPGYNDGQTPYGVWIATRAVIDPKWSSNADPDHDVAFLVVRRPGSNTKIQDVTGAEKLGVDRSANSLVRVIGYPDTDNQPISCQNRATSFSARQMQFYCQNYTDGTSGGPFLSSVNSSRGTGTVIGVIGGYQQGGDNPDVSYSVTFDDDTRALYNTAVSMG